MSPRPRLSGLNLWKRHEDYVLNVFREALQLLRNDLPDSDDEISLNRALYLKVITVIHGRLRSGRSPLHVSPPMLDAPNPPSPATAGTGAESKRPDFLWGYVDSSEPDPERSVRHLAIECKRLGHALSSGWNLNRNYVWNGIARFVDSVHSYGKDAKSGAMIGYVQSMSETEILDVVNKEAAVLALPGLELPVPVADGLIEMQHHLTRSFAPVDFALHHIWADVQVKVDIEHPSPVPDASAGA